MAFSSRGSGPYGSSADINVTPLIDVMLVLLIVFMVTAPLLTTGMKVNLPQSRAAKPIDPKEPAVVAVAKDGRVFIGTDEIALDRLVPAVTAAIENDLSRVVHLRGDKDASYGDVVKVMDLLASSGITHLAVVANRRSAGEAGHPAPRRATGSEP
ncbi:Biopolymer transport protein ExbD/TolR [Methylobacterium sp. 4-46]|uniref:ExbD/TolR family protein n=1 Tax=unclassified Methylobacterium TaxID=2615210 RepID=UPI000152E525|nr:MULTISPECIES: biopolymer transporter ExbD [Methylobacterium]ACA15069.1 Biopolymer transport protein ExbD/TolR [Methylobacterium sp. 4-46]WFT80805.1 biopolymer transporter ExbD [Methylobacterium nodulans]